MNIFTKIKKWFENVGRYRITTDSYSYEYPAFIVEVQGLASWHTVKIFIDEDAEYARICAFELLEKLEEKIN